MKQLNEGMNFSDYVLVTAAVCFSEVVVLRWTFALLTYVSEFGMPDGRRLEGPDWTFLLNINRFMKIT